MKHLSRNENGFGSIEILLLVLILAVVCFGGYYVYHNDHKAKSPSTGSVIAKSNTTNSSSSPSPYVGWKTYTTKNEKLSFKYPTTWTLVDYSDPTDGDAVNVTGTNNATLAIDIGPGNAGFNCPDGGCNVMKADTVTFLGQTVYFDSYSGSGQDPVQSTQLSKSSTDVGPANYFPTKNFDTSDSESTISISYGYSGSSQQGSTTESLSYTLNDVNYKDAKLIIESMSY